MAIGAIAIVSLILLSVLVFALASFIAKHRSVAALKLLPGRKPSYLFGNALQLTGEAHVVIQRILQWMEEYNHEGLMCLWLGPTYPLTMIFKPELAEIILSSSKHMTKSPDYEMLHPWLGTGLLTSDGNKWKKRRKLITPTFHFRILNDFIQVCEEQTAILISRLKEKVNKGVFDIMPYITLLTLDIICVTSMGPSPKAQEKSSSPYVRAVVRVSELLEHRGRSPWLWPDIIYNLSPSGREFNKCLDILHGFTDKVIDEQIAGRAATKRSVGEQGQQNNSECQTKRKRLAFLDTLLEAYEDGEISREGVREEVDTFMFEGHDTTAAGITWALYLLGRHPDIQQRVYEEVDRFFARLPDVLTVEDLKEFRYMEYVLKESQRLLPSVPFYSRTTTEDCYLGDFFLPKGSAVTISTLALHKNPEVWPAPLDFDPDRFLPENIKGRHPFAFLPFSAGPRNCIGQRLALLEEKLVLAHVLRHFKIQSTQSYDELQLCSELILRPKEGVFVTLTDRQ
ncbi:Cytochrome P450 4V2 [Porites harrisoni]